MKTKLANGEPYTVECLINEFALRIETLNDLAEFATMGEGVPQLAQTLAHAIGRLSNDWDVFEDALRAQLDEVEPATGETPR